MNGQRVRILNLHLDHISDKARVLGMKVIIDKYVEYKRKNYLPTVMLGDFNCHKDSMVIMRDLMMRHLMKNAHIMSLEKDAKNLIIFFNIRIV